MKNSITSVLMKSLDEVLAIAKEQAEDDGFQGFLLLGGFGRSSKVIKVFDNVIVVIHEIDDSVEEFSSREDFEKSNPNIMKSIDAGKFYQFGYNVIK